MRSELEKELRTYLDTLVITQYNIGDIRRSCFVPWNSEWNGFVRDATARREIPNDDPRATPPPTEAPAKWTKCEAAARHAYSDATFARFFYDKCEEHRIKATTEPTTIQEAARRELLETLGDLVDRYDYEIVRDALWQLKPDVTGQFWCGDCRRYVDAIIHGCKPKRND